MNVMDTLGESENFGATTLSPSPRDWCGEKDLHLHVLADTGSQSDNRIKSTHHMSFFELVDTLAIVGFCALPLSYQDRSPE